MFYERENKCKIAYIKYYDNAQELTNRENCQLIDKIIFKYKILRNKINIKKFGKDYIIVLPINRKENKIKKNNKIVQTLNFELERLRIDAIVVPDYFDMCSKITSCKILNGKTLLKNIITDIMLYLDRGENSIQLARLHILVNEYTRQNIGIIKELARKVKCLNIITENLKFYKKIQEELYEQEGIAISVTNNKKKSLKKSQLIVNFDFYNEQIKKYVIDRECRIINLAQENLELKNSYNGIIVNSANIHVSKKIIEFFEMHALINNFNILELYESLVYNNSHTKICEKIIKDKVQIVNLLGNRGIINNSELSITNV